MAQAELKRTLSPTHAPIFFAFFTWGFGTGAQHLARPLFAYALTENVFLVAVVIGMNAIPRIFTGPLTGYLTDRIGRKPLAIAGAALRGVTNVGQYLVGDFALFLVLEFVGQIGVSMWNTSSNVLLSEPQGPAAVVQLAREVARADGADEELLDGGKVHAEVLHGGAELVDFHAMVDL